MNYIEVMGGSNHLSVMTDNPNYRYRWTIDFGYIMSSDPFEDDFGILEITDEVFFNTSTLMDPSALPNARIVPICLGAIGTDIKNKDVQSAGWGRMYDEAPKSNPRNPEFSSCMTTQASPKNWKFQNCDMQRMKRGNNFKCDKTNPPPGYQQEQLETCRRLFMIPDSEHGKAALTKITKEKIKNVEKVYHMDMQDTTKLLTCVNPKILQTFGWCYLKDYPEKHEDKNWSGEAWGICSPSCDSKLMKVKPDTNFTT